MLSENINRALCHLILKEVDKWNPVGYYPSPGMRNAPLLAVLANDEIFQKRIIGVGIDERANAYRALGASKVSGNLSVLLCTSGTALSNYIPAITEAKSSDVPMLIITADRPFELVEGHANQTIDQKNMLGSIVKKSLHLETLSEGVSPMALQSMVSHLVQTALTYPQGPVHLNIPMRNSLDQTKEDISSEFLTKLKSAFIIINKTYEVEKLVDGKLPSHFKEILEKAVRPLVVIGELPYSVDKNELFDSLREFNGILYADIGSTIKYHFPLENGGLPGPDHPELLEQLKKINPDCILQIGERLVSKNYYQYLEDHPEINYLLIGHNQKLENPALRPLVQLIACPVQAGTQAIKYINGKNSREIFSQTLPLLKKFTNAKRELIEKSPLSFPFLSKSLVEGLPNECTLYLGNSTTIRSFDSFISVEKTKHLPTLTHRGVSGIEGMIASSIGAREALSKDKKLVLVVGDLSFIHDLSSLHLLSSLKDQLTIIVVNNFGGGIFNLLPVSAEEKLNPYLTTPHNQSFEKCIEAFSIPYKKVSTKENLMPSCLELLKHSGPSVLEVIIDDKENQKVYAQLRTIKL